MIEKEDLNKISELVKTVVKTLTLKEFEELKHAHRMANREAYLLGDQSKNYTFVQFIAAMESFYHGEEKWTQETYPYNFDNIDPDWLDWANKNIEHMLKELKTGHHDGSCIQQPCSCAICLYQTWLEEYEEYCRDSKVFRKEYEK